MDQCRWEKEKGRRPMHEQWVTTSRLKPVFKTGRDAVLAIQDASGSVDLLTRRRAKFIEYWSENY